MNLPFDADEEVDQRLRLTDGHQKNIVRPHMSSTIDNPATSETVNSAVNDVDSTDQVFQHILSKEEIVNELALLYVRKKLSFSALGAIAKLIVALGHNIPIYPRTILQTTNTELYRGFFQFSGRGRI